MAVSKRVNPIKVKIKIKVKAKKKRRSKMTITARMKSRRKPHLLCFTAHMDPTVFVCIALLCLLAMRAVGAQTSSSMRNHAGVTSIVSRSMPRR